MKKGISPLIATILLIGFTVALAVVVFNWGVGFVQNAQENVEKTTESSLACTNKLNFDIKEVRCNLQEQKIVIENNGEADIVNLTLRVHHAGEKITPISFSEGIPSFGANTFDLTAQGLIAGNEVDAIATIKSDSGSNILCSQIIKSKKYSCDLTPPAP